jgi:DNA-binding FrmR family transcriptional regulator
MAPSQTSVVKADLLQRLRRVEGQVRGIQKMLEEDRECREVIQQLNAVQAALQTTADRYVRAHAKECLLNADATAQRDPEAMIDTLLDLMIKARA